MMDDLLKDAGGSASSVRRTGFARKCFTSISYSRLIKRYSANYAGWCVAFGEHDTNYDENKETNWLFGDSKIGFILSPPLKRIFFHELMGKHKHIPLISILESEIRLNGYRIPITLEEDRRGLASFKKFISTKKDVHLCLTSHFCYPPGTRIITFTKKKPLIIIYKEVQPMQVEIGHNLKWETPIHYRTSLIARAARGAPTGGDRPRWQCA